MFWASLLLGAFALALIKVGALSVWVQVLTAALWAAGLLLAAAVVVLAWRLIVRG